MLDRFGRVVAGNQLNWRALLVAEQTDDVGATLDTFSRIVPLADHERARIERELRRRRRFIPVMVREFLTWEEMARSRSTPPTCPASWSMSAPRGCIRTAGAGRMWSATSRRRARRDMADDPMLALPGIRVGRAGHGEGATTWRCAAGPARCSWRSTRSAG